MVDTTDSIGSQTDTTIDESKGRGSLEERGSLESAHAQSKKDVVPAEDPIEHEPSPVSRSGRRSLVGMVLKNRYKILAPIGEGGVGAVYRAEDLEAGQTVAIKVLDPLACWHGDDSLIKRFHQEAAIATKLSHPNTVRVLDFGRTDDDVFFIAMECLEGKTLQRLLHDEGPFSGERMLQVALQVARSLDEAHSAGIIHRDLKPSNIFLFNTAEEEDFVKVLDFGLAKDLNHDENLTKCVVLGTPSYMAPEQSSGGAIDARADIYALGVNMYEMVTGVTPFRREDAVRTILAHAEDPVPSLRLVRPNLTISSDIEAAIHKCLEKKPEARYQSMRELVEDLEAIRSESRTQSPSGAPFVSVANIQVEPLLQVTRLPRPVLIFGVAASVLLCIGALAMRGRSSKTSAEPSRGAEISQVALSQAQASRLAKSIKVSIEHERQTAMANAAQAQRDSDITIEFETAGDSGDGQRAGGAANPGSSSDAPSQVVMRKSPRKAIERAREDAATSATQQPSASQAKTAARPATRRAREKASTARPARADKPVIVRRNPF